MNKTYDFIRYETRIRRELYNGITKESVGNYVRSLEHELNELKNLSWTARETLGVSKETIEQHENAVNKEIGTAKFYLAYFKRMKEPNFNKWVLTNEQKIEIDYNQQPSQTYEYQVEKWSKTNGKIIVIITITPPYKRQASTRVSIAIGNDSDILTFYENGSNTYPHELSYTNLRKPESIANQVEAYKKEAEELFKKYSYPHYSKELREIEEYETLLHIEK